MQVALIGRLFVLAAVAALVFAAPALAADAHGHGEGGGILDKMKFTGIHRWDLGLYTLIVFGLLMLILSWKAWPQIRAGLEKRELTITSALDEARKDRAAAAELMAQAKKELDATAGKVKEMLDEARRDAEALKAAKTEEGAKEAQAERDRAKREVEQERAALTKDIQQQAVELAVLIATKALRQQVSVDQQARLLDESIAELKANSRA
jgi:F-type H+-transporting ATPase subunit b